MTSTTAFANSSRVREAQGSLERLAVGPTSHRDEREIVDVLRGLDQMERGEVLRLFDGSVSHHDIRHLVEDDIDDPRLRAEAQGLIDDARPFMKSAGRIILSDIDQTVVPGFADPDLKGDVYPGVRALLRALDRGVDDADVEGDVRFVTARDGILIRATNTLKKAGVDFGSISYGRGAASLLGLWGFHKPMENEKVRDIHDLLDRNPSRRAVLMGDTVQADPAVYRRILQDRPDRVEVVLIHVVRGFPCPPDMLRDPRVVAFADYGEAARELCDRGVLTEAQRDEVLLEIAEPI